MSNPELSRRVARVMHIVPIYGLDEQAKRAFVAAVDTAADFADLAPAYQQLILAAERAYQPRSVVFERRIAEELARG